MEKINGKRIFLVVVVIVGFPIIAYMLWSIYNIFGGIRNRTLSCSNIEVIANPLYDDKKIDSNNSSDKSNFGRKGNDIYSMSKGGWEEDVCVKIKKVDKNTFKVLSSSYAKDINNAYVERAVYSRETRSQNEFIIPGIDYDTFMVLGGGYSRDKNHIYKGVDVLSDFDLNTFEILTDNNGFIRYIRDKNKVLSEATYGEYNVNFAKTVDTNTFQLLNEYYSKDQKYVYDSNSRIIIGADPASFQIVKKMNVCYEYGSPIVALCPYDYDAWDKENKYMHGKISGKAEGIITEEISMTELKKIDFDNEQIFLSQAGLPGSAVWDRLTANGFIKLSTGVEKNNSGYPFNMALYINDIEIPKDSEFMKFKFNFRNTRNLSQAFILSSIIGTEYVFRAVADEYDVESWQSSGWIPISRYAGKKLHLNFNLSRFKESDNNEEGVVQLDNIIFAKVER